MIFLHGVLTLTSPLHTSAGTKGLRLQRDGHVVYKDNEGIPVVSTVTSPITVRGRFHGDLPVFPSSGIIGRLRRLAAKRVRAALASDNKTIPQALYYAYMSGHAPGPQLGANYTLADYESVNADMFFGMFGGGSLRHAARYIQGDLVPVTNVTIDAGLVPQKFADLAPMGAQRDVEPWQLFDYRVVRKIDDIGRGRDPAENVDLLADDERREAAVAYQTIPIGTPMYWRTQIDERTTPQQRGLLLMALHDLCALQQLGGKVHLGWGGFTAQRFRLVDGDDRHDLFDLRYDEEGQATLATTTAFEKLCAPCRKELARLAKKPADARQALRALLHA
jgi:hypothetical protein